MASSQTIKQRFLDILFEDEDDEEEVRKPSNKETRVKASDLLYGKKETNEVNEKKEEKIEKPIVKKESESAFINYDQKASKEEKKDIKLEEIYVAQPALSPIFGNIEKENDKKKKDEVISVDYASIEKPGSNYLGTVLSPIYGYDTITANDARSKLDVKKEEKEEQLEKTDKQEDKILDKDITEDLSDIFATDEYKQEAFKQEDNVEDSIDLFGDFYKEQ